MIASKGDEMQLTYLLISPQAPRHEARLERTLASWLRRPNSPSLRKEGDRPGHPPHSAHFLPSGMSKTASFVSWSDIIQ
jgi:hypothetical protein